MTKDFFTVEEIADLLRIRPGTVRNRLSRNDPTLPPSTVNGRRRLFPVTLYELWKQEIALPDLLPAFEKYGPNKKRCGRPRNSGSGSRG